NSDSSLLSKGFFKILKLFYGKKPDVWTVKEDRKNEVENLIKKIDENLSEKKFGYIISIEGYLLLLINEFLTSYLERREIVEKKASKKEIIFKKVVNFITENIEKQVTIKEIAKNYYFSVNYIQKIIKEFTGRSFTRFMHDIKIEYVKELLKNTTLEIKEIAGRCGFYDQNYFTRIFKKIEGIPPSKYREI
ncbi:MAG TPA: AraC family transcriptional regulator, partial [bacterium]|nr:AraC family transcriptional regulator [bacterium]